MTVYSPRKTSFEFKREDLIATTPLGYQNIRYYLAVLEGERLTQYIKAIDDLKTTSAWWKSCSAAQRQELNSLRIRLMEDLDENVRQRRLACGAVSQGRNREAA